MTLKCLEITDPKTIRVFKANLKIKLSRDHLAGFGIASSVYSNESCGIVDTSGKSHKGDCMPTYVYEVIQEDGSPGETFEVIQPISAKPLTEHPETGQPVQRVIQPPFIGGSWSESSMHKNANDDKKLERLGFTKYVKSGDGTYEKTVGKGPKSISKDAPVNSRDLKHLD